MFRKNLFVVYSREFQLQKNQILKDTPEEFGRYRLKKPNRYKWVLSTHPYRYQKANVRNLLGNGLFAFRQNGLPVKIHEAKLWNGEQSCVCHEGSLMETDLNSKDSVNSQNAQDHYQSKHVCLDQSFLVFHNG
jgi:hypothetical protein